MADEGKGFDYAERFAETEGDAVDRARDRYKGGGMGGLGFALIKKCVDRIGFNESGSRVVLTCLIRSKVPQKPAPRP